MTQDLTTQTAEIQALADLKGLPDLWEIDENDDSPMAELTPKMRMWTIGWLALNGEPGSLKKAALFAGYAPATCANAGSRLIRDPRILAAIKHLAEQKAHTSAYAAMGTLEELMRTAPAAQRLKAAQAMLGHAGLIIKLVHEHELTIKDNRSEAQILKAVQEKAKELGLGGNMIDITPSSTKMAKEDKISADAANRPAGMNQGTKIYKRYLVPNRELSEDELEEVDWTRMEV